MKISFCMTCKGRAHHVRRTLPQAISDNVGGGVDVEFILLDYNSPDGLKEWVANDAALAPHLELGVLIYAFHPDAPYFHHSHAKNMAHRLATGDVVCNLDADNYAGPGFARWLAATFAADPNALVVPDRAMLGTLPIDERGAFGRIAMTRENFMRLGGYDEGLFGWGGEDTNLVIRALAAGLKPHTFGNADFAKVIPHSDAERVAYCFPDKVEEVLKRRLSCHAQSMTFNRAKEAFRSLVGAQRNSGHFGQGCVERGKDGRFETLDAPGGAAAGRVSGNPLRAAMRYAQLRTSRG